ncbi:hypothetical protein BH24ACI2_BH24ACI2_00860 [soil metagenome]
MGKLASEDIQIQKLLDSYLRLQVSKNGFTAEGEHLDEDFLTAFVEGNLNRREARPVVNHLAACMFCRQVTAELVKLDLAFADDQARVFAKEDEPSKVSEVLNGLLSRIFGTNDDVVFAHQEQEKEEPSEKTENSPDNKQ